MPTRKEEREQRRAARLEAERRETEAQRRRLVAGYIVAGLLTAAVIVGLVVVIAGSGGGGGEEAGDFPEAAHIRPEFGTVDDVEPDDREGTEPPPVQEAVLDRAAREANCDLRLDLPDEGATHVSDDTVNYETNPPTSGNHNPEPQADGAYREQPDPVHYVHSMEHGRIEIQYSPSLPEKDQLALKGIFDESPAGMLLFPNPDMPYEVAATAWTQLVGCKTYEGRATLDVIRAFRDTYRGQGPEPVAIF